MRKQQMVVLTHYVLEQEDKLDIFVELTFLHNRGAGSICTGIHTFAATFC